LGVFVFFTVDYDKEGGGPIKMKISEANIQGFVSPQEHGYFQFIAPATLVGSPFPQEVCVNPYPFVNASQAGRNS